MPEFYSAVTAVGPGESNWLDFDSAPAADNNVKDFFNPELDFTFYVNNADVNMTVVPIGIEEMVMEFRGSRI